MDIDQYLPAILIKQLWLCHGKTCLKILISVIHKEGLPILFGYDTDYKIVLCRLHRLYFVVGVILKEGLAGPRPPILLLVWQWQRFKAWFPMTWLNCDCAIHIAHIGVRDQGISWECNHLVWPRALLIGWPSIERAVQSITRVLWVGVKWDALIGQCKP